MRRFSKIVRRFLCSLTSSRGEHARHVYFTTCGGRGRGTARSCAKMPSAIPGVPGNKNKVLGVRPPGGGQFGGVSGLQSAWIQLRSHRRYCIRLGGTLVLQLGNQTRPGCAIGKTCRIKGRFLTLLVPFKMGTPHIKSLFQLADRYRLGPKTMFQLADRYSFS